MEELFLSTIKNNKGAIFRMCLAYTSSYEDAKDLFQEVLLNAWKAIGSFQNKSSVNTWLYRITINVCLRANQKINKRKSRFLNADGLALESLQISEPHQKSYPELYHCIKSLNEIERSIVMLFLEDMPYKEIAEITGLSANNIAVKMTRIKCKLFHCLIPIL